MLTVAIEEAMRSYARERASSATKLFRPCLLMVNSFWVPSAQTRTFFAMALLTDAASASLSMFLRLKGRVQSVERLTLLIVSLSNYPLGRAVVTDDGDIDGAPSEG